MISVDHAAASLCNELRMNDWFNTVGIAGPPGKHSLIVYVKKSVSVNNREKLEKEGWMGFKVAFKAIGRVQLALS